MKVDRLLAEFQTEILFLLIGQNPLPNAVSAALLAHPGLRIVLVHSQGTAEIARSFRGWLLQRVKVTMIETISIRESDPASVWTGITNYLDKTDPKTVGINYTGGTKLMSVHSHDAVKAWCRQKRTAPVQSYLDARRLHMVFEPVQPETGELSRSVYIGDRVTLDLRELLELHRWTLLNDPRQVPVFPNVAREIALLYQKDPEIWKEWKRDELYSKCKDSKPRENFRSNADLKNVSLCFPDDPGWQGFRHAFRLDTNLSADGFALSQLSEISGFNPRYDLTETAKYLDGTWLEHYTMDNLNEIRAKAKINDIRQSIETNGVRFELDVAAMCGYQLFAFSCGSERRWRWNPDKRANEEDISNLKLKLFEAYIRATQIGGDEANVALVTVLDAPDRLERQLSQNLLPPDQNSNHLRIKVFGRNDLPVLRSKLLNWINDCRGDKMP